MDPPDQGVDEWHSTVMMKKVVLRHILRRASRRQSVSQSATRSLRLLHFRPQLSSNTYVSAQLR